MALRDYASRSSSRPLSPREREAVASFALQAIACGVVPSLREVSEFTVEERAIWAEALRRSRGVSPPQAEVHDRDELEEAAERELARVVLLKARKAVAS